MVGRPAAKLWPSSASEYWEKPREAAGKLVFGAMTWASECGGASHLCARLEARGDRLGALLAATAAAARDAALTPVSGTLEVAPPAVADPTVPMDVRTGKHLGRDGVEASHTEAP
mmetsp:Transcript_2132/g.6089  ORF Transcript_2132/g.6089 Transcript_2132/m.6089 type:complete len:115 (-) Transcript_2132:1516-1860(-)